MLTDFLKQYGILLVAIYGVIQVWLIAIWKNYFRKGKVVIFKTGKLEIGFSNFGPTLAINGTLGAEYKDVFVSEIYLNLTRYTDQSTHKFYWTALRPNQFTLGPSTPITLEIPSAFIVKPDFPYRFHIFFSDRESQNEIQPYLMKVITEWNEFIIGKQEDILHLMRDYTVPREQAIEHLYDKEFSRESGASKEAWDILSRKNYWEPGDYNVDLIVDSYKPRAVFSDSFMFLECAICAVATLREICTLS